MAQRTLKSRLDENQLSEIYECLIGDLIHEDTKKEDFINAFSYKDIRCLENRKIQWIGRSRVFSVLIFGTGKPKLVGKEYFKFDGIVHSRYVGHPKLLHRIFEFPNRKNKHPITDKLSEVHKNKIIHSLGLLEPVFDILQNKSNNNSRLEHHKQIPVQTKENIINKDVPELEFEDDQRGPARELPKEFKKECEEPKELTEKEKDLIDPETKFDKEEGWNNFLITLGKRCVSGDYIVISQDEYKNTVEDLNKKVDEVHCMLEPLKYVVESLDQIKEMLKIKESLNFDEASKFLGIPESELYKLIALRKIYASEDNMISIEDLKEYKRGI